MTSIAQPSEANTTVPLRSVVANAELALDVVRDSLPADALERPVCWAHVSELLDPTPYLHGEELLLTAGVNLPAAAEDVATYVRRLRDAGVTALGFGITPPQHEVLPAELRDACVRHGLPLLVAPTRTPFLAISRAVSLEISRAAQREQRGIAEAREALTKLAGAGASALVRELADRISGWLALVRSDDRIAADSGAPWPFPAEVDALLAQLRAGSGIRSATTTLADGTHVVAQPVSPQAIASHLLVAGKPDRFGRTDLAIIAIGAALLGLVGRTGSDTARLGSAAVSGALADVPQAEVLAQLVPAHDYRLVAGVPAGAGPREAEAGYDWLRTRLNTPLVRLGPGPRFTAIIGQAPSGDTVADLREHGWLVAVGGPVAAERLPNAVAELRTLSHRAVSLGRPVVFDPADGLTALVPREAAAAFARRALAELHRLDTERGDDVLVRTLRSWLAHHGRWDRAAAALGVHRNSVRHRIAQVERALGVDLSDPDTRMELWFALRWSS